jgi:hypothetical protein
MASRVFLRSSGYGAVGMDTDGAGRLFPVDTCLRRSPLVGVQGAHVANQTRIFAHMPEARSRINTIYIFSFFAGGAFGSVASTSIWTLAGWPGVCLFGGTLMGLALLAGFAFSGHSGKHAKPGESLRTDDIGSLKDDGK